MDSQDVLTPLVSVVIATRNRPAKLQRLRSRIKQQNPPGLPRIVVDDGSTENLIGKYKEILPFLDQWFQFKFREKIWYSAKLGCRALCCAARH